MPTPRGHVAALNQGLRVFFSEFVRVSLRHPAQALFYGRTVRWQVQAARRRSAAARQGLDVPPIAIFSITNACNLACKGCYHRALHSRPNGSRELDAADIRRLLAEAQELGVSFFVIAGGEPLTRPEIVDIAAEFPRIIFLLVTNGILLDSPLIARLARQRNTVPVLSMEGDRAQTDGRRGDGMHQRLRSRMAELARRHLFYSLSCTVSRENFDTVTDPAFIEEAVRTGCRLFLLLEYTPIAEGTDDWMLTAGQREAMRGLVAGMRKRFPAVFIAVPWDEEDVGGCLAAGRGFVHISAEGRVEPCPFAPYSDSNLAEMPLRQALASPFLRRLREEHGRFEDTTQGCSLWRERDRVRALLDGTGG